MKSVDKQRPDVRKQIAATKEQLSTARRERTRVENLLKANAANRKQLDDWDSQIAVLQSQLEAQISSLTNSTQSLNEQSSSVAIQILQTEDQLNKCHILSPINGTVLAKYAEPGELASTGKPLFKIADTENIFLRAYVTSSQLEEVKLGSLVKVFADFGDKNRKEYQGTVSWIADEAEFTPKTILTDDERANQVYAVKIAVKMTVSLSSACMEKSGSVKNSNTIKTMTPVIEIEHISKRYDKTEALHDVSFTVQRGELFGLIGPDGAGKSTLFRILTTLLNADSGKASVLNHDVCHDYRTIRQTIGYMPGRFSLYQDLTVEENLNFFATIFHTTVAEHYHQIKDIYEQIAPFRNRRAGALSGGMKQKLALCCALIHSPEVLFLDEPTTGVDPVSRKEFWQMLGRLRDQGITIMVSTPFMDEARKCERIAFLYEGKIQGIDTPDIILEKFKDILCPPRLKRNNTDNDYTPVIRVHELVKQFGTFTAVDHISFEVKRGEIFGFLGANGAGKTTAMRILCGLSLPSAGHAEVMGYDVSTQSEDIKRNIGYMSQKFSLYEDLTVWENLRLFGGIYGIREKEIPVRAEEMLNRIGLYNERNTLVRELPLGWKQRLAFSAAIFHRPQVVFLDEPTGGVDPATRRQFWQLIYQAADQGITVFVTTHYMDEAEYCDRISMMVDGRIRALDTPEALKSHFHAKDMDEVFQMLAREAKRSSD